MSENNISPKGHNWDEVESRLYTPEEIAASNLRVAMMIELANARAERGISQKKLEAISVPFAAIPDADQPIAGMGNFQRHRVCQWLETRESIFIQEGEGHGSR